MNGGWSAKARLSTAASSGTSALPADRTVLPRSVLNGAPFKSIVVRTISFLSSSSLLQHLRNARLGGQAGRAIRDRSVRFQVPLLFGLSSFPGPQQRPGEDGSRDHDRGAQGGGQLQRLGECLAGRVDQIAAKRLGKVIPRGHGTPE